MSTSIRDFDGVTRPGAPRFIPPPPSGSKPVQTPARPPFEADAITKTPRALAVIRPRANPLARIATALVDLVTGPFRGADPASSAAWGAVSASRSGVPVSVMHSLHVGLEYELTGKLYAAGGTAILELTTPIRVGAEIVESVRVRRGLPSAEQARLHGALVKTADGFALGNVSDMNAGEPLYDSGRFLDVRGNVLETTAIDGSVRVFDIYDRRTFDARFEGEALVGFVEVTSRRT